MTDDLNKKPQDSEEQGVEFDISEDTEATSAHDQDMDDVVVDEDGESSQAEVIKKLRLRLKQAVDEKQTYLTNWQRDKAEFVNARKRDEESKADYLKFATQKVIEDILPVLDSFDMATANTASWESVSKEWRTGIEGIYGQLQSVLSRYEVTSYTKVGDTFDPNLHHSIAAVPTDDKSADHTVAEVLQKGYKIKDKVLRAALVKVFEA
ncbi:MAG: hypothetical protein RL094_518 [Candidatus Parcubacteria bacterium]|jgi:molecular chaperone GrpE